MVLTDELAGQAAQGGFMAVAGAVLVVIAAGAGQLLWLWHGGPARCSAPLGWLPR